MTDGQGLRVWSLSVTRSLRLKLVDEARMSKSPSNDPLVVGGVIGDVLEDFIPSVQLTVRYPSRQIVNSCELKLPDVTEAPIVQVLDRTFPDAIFTLIMTDPDVPTPSNPSHKEYLHWLITDIPSRGDSNAGRCVVPYESPKPTMIGIHRLVFSVFRQQHPLELYPPSTRHKFCTRLVAQQFNLGKPVGAIFFNAKKETRARKR
ncbi:hypothetical protein R1sor_023643 [Riccia sorocarpa]|uniref:Uncharacterized protein n=1 Tax=Riccia sorocarpa TaxID=122646 RepID=A0ABD3GN90_9MARC